MKTTSISVGCAALLAVAASTPAYSSVLYDNLTAASQDFEEAGYLYGDGPLYDSFSTGNSSFHLVDVSLEMGANPWDGMLWGAGLLSDQSGSPGNAIVAWNFLPDSMLSLVPGVVTLGTNVILSPDTRYWIVVVGLDSFGPSSAGWYYSNDDTRIGVAGEYWGDASGIYANDVGHGPFQMAISTPEPSTWAMLLVGFAGLGFAGYRASRKAISTPA